jgi:uncharacterized protein YkwD
MNAAHVGRRVARTATTTLLALFMVLGALSITPTASASNDGAVTASQADTYEGKVQYWVNRQRVQRGLPRVRLANCTDQVAEEWSKHLSTTGQFYHQSMADVLDACNAVYAGETLGRGTMGPRKLVRMWMQSDPHRVVLLSSKSRHIGIGANYDGTGRWVVAANFMRF